TLVEPETCVRFPSTIQPPSCPPLTLVGLGVRVVSFLKLKVYAVGFYAEPALLQTTEDAPFEEKIERIIQTSACAIRIVPVRSTSYTHLRDAFIRALRLRIALEESLQRLKGIFPISSFEKNSSLLVYSVPEVHGGLKERTLIFDGLGEIQSAWMAANFFYTYFTGKGVSPAVSQMTPSHIEKILKKWTYVVAEKRQRVPDLQKNLNGGVIIIRRKLVG
ncbi:chalcone-flavanone isomerase-domain-containing protein, partial [Cantharellus anzutake]|uniref:chalcone-flavanone isomerase-domain-containing protein n=1 Tax=Cantharellus anzutake TaxID=1750568 RepID=UPI0019061F1F